MSLLSNGSAHSGQNFGGLCGSAGTQPQLSQRYVGAPEGFGLAHSEQNLPWFTAPHEHVQPSAAAGFGFAHSEQNLPEFTAPHEQVQLP